jgi:hypothetical protein
VSEITDRLIEQFQAFQSEPDNIEYVKTDDLGEHYVLWVERTTKDGGPAGIWFYIDEINTKLVVESFGASAKPGGHEAA